MVTKQVQTTMVTGPAWDNARYEQPGETYPIHCTGCGDSLLTTDGGLLYISAVLVLHQVACGTPKVWRGYRQRVWTQALLRGEAVPVPTRRRDSTERVTSGAQKRSYFKVLARLRDRGIPAHMVDAGDVRDVIYAYQVDVVDAAHSIRLGWKG